MVENSERDCKYLDGLNREQLLDKIAEAESEIREQTNAIESCLKRLGVIG